MHAGRKTIAFALTVAGLAMTAPAGEAAPFLPVGSGTWGPSISVNQSSGCKGVTTSTDDCEITASSIQSVPPLNKPVETCTNVSYVATSPVIIGTDFGCTINFKARLRLTGTGTGMTIGESQDETAIDIEVGACAGLTLLGPTIQVNDGAIGNYTVYPRVTVTNAGWTIQGSLVAIDASAASVVVLHVAGKITPACKMVRTRAGAKVVTFNGKFSGSYQFL